MSAAASSSAALPRAASASWLTRFVNSSIGQKAVMAATGTALSGFVLAHMTGNLTMFHGADAIDAYSAGLHKLPALLWTARLGLLAAVLLHIWAYLALTRRSVAARPQGYRVTAYKESSYASRTMRYTGPLLLVFIIYHLLHMTVGAVHPDFREGEVYHNLQTGLRVVPVALFYFVALAALAFHLFHGIWSLFQTLGAGQPRYDSLGRRLATVFTVIVVGGFALVPLSILAGIGK